jgi:hypothetical protein
MEKEVIEGYGPPDLVDRVSNASWQTCAPSGKNFRGISLAGLLLTDSSDVFLPVRFRVTLKEVVQRKQVVVDCLRTGIDVLDVVEPSSFTRCPIW